VKILVTGGSGVIGAGVIPELLARGHDVRLHDLDGCDAVLHIGGVNHEELLAAAHHANVKRFVYVTSPGDDAGIAVVRQSQPPWTIVRPTTVYGPHDRTLSLLLEMMRALPAVPMPGGGAQELRPIWYEDLGRILATTFERGDAAGQVLDAIGPEIITIAELLRRFAEITERSPLRVPVPMTVAEHTTRLAALAVELSLPQPQDVVNAAAFLGVSMTPLDHGLRLLADALPEVTPDEGFGGLEHKRFHAEVRGSRHTAATLMALFRDRVNDFMPVEFAAEPDVPERVEEGLTLTGALPLRGNFQVRVELAEPSHVIFATIEGHPLAGIVEFTSRDLSDAGGGAIEFAIDVFARASNPVDWIAIRTVGALAQSANWRVVVQRMIDASGGTSDGVRQEKEMLRGDAAAAVERRVRALIAARKREEPRDSAASERVP
jgi:uncharacterized protein YbjT (DUF2867 family)